MMMSRIIFVVIVGLKVVNLVNVTPSDKQHETP